MTSADQDTMEAMLSSLSPNDLILIGSSFFTSFLTAAVGIGGGTLLLAVMAQILPAAAIIPVHGVVQLGSNLGRSLLMLAHIHWPLVCVFIAGSLVGALVGGQLVVSLPSTILKPILGVFILYSVWGPTFKTSTLSQSGLALGGAVTTLLTLFVGATGPLVLSLVRTFKLSPAATVATNSICVLMQHGLKIAVFGFLGFAFAPYLTLVAAMITTGFIGTYLGRAVLLKTPPAHFDGALKIILSILAVRLLLPL